MGNRIEGKWKTTYLKVVSSILSCANLQKICEFFFFLFFYDFPNLFSFCSNQWIVLYLSIERL